MIWNENIQKIYYFIAFQIILKFLIYFSILGNNLKTHTWYWKYINYRILSFYVCESFIKKFLFSSFFGTIDHITSGVNDIGFLFIPAGRELDGDSRGYRSAEEQARELTRSIRREVNKLSEQWNALIERSDAWKRKLDDSTTVSKFLIFL